MKSNWNNNSYASSSNYCCSIPTTKQQRRSTMLLMLLQLILLLLLLLCMLILPNYNNIIVIVHAVPIGFIDEGIIAYRSPMSAIFVPNINRISTTTSSNNTVQQPSMLLMIAKKSGTIDIIHNWDDPTIPSTTTTILDISNSICENGPRGIQTIVAHPNFSTSNPYIYIYYTRYSNNCLLDAILGPSNRVSRFTLSINNNNNNNTYQIDPTTEVVLLETPPSTNTMHDGGAMMISSKDNHLYIGTGDGGDISYSQNLQNCWGKILRISIDINNNNNNGIATTTIPIDNPFINHPNYTSVPCRYNRGVLEQNAPDNAVCEEIYAYGLRNPFRMTEDITTTTSTSNPNDDVLFSICDVGGATWEEISYGGTQYSGHNYGWPIVEGPCLRNSNSECTVPNTTFVDPYYYYQHNTTTGAAVVGIIHVPNTIQNWPKQESDQKQLYQKFYIDHMEGAIYNLIQDNQTNECRTCTPPRSKYRKEVFHKHPRIVDSFFGPLSSRSTSNSMSQQQQQQALYYLSRDETTTNVRRIYYTSSTNDIPIARITGLESYYDINKIISFNGSTSSDNDNDTLTYEWDFGDTTIANSNAINPKVQYMKLGSYTVTLTVTDTMNQSNQDKAIIVIGRKPNVEIITPIEGNEFKIFDVLRLKGIGFDYNNNRTIANETQYEWEVRQYHENHYHPFLETRSGNDFDLYPAPKPEDLYATTNSYLQILCTVYDSNGIANTITRNVYPKKVFINVTSEPSGLQILVENIVYTTPTTITTWQNQNVTFIANDQNETIFTSWSIVGVNETPNRQLSYLVPPNNITRTITARFRTKPQPTNTSRPTMAAPKATKAPSRGPILSIPTKSPLSIVKSKPPTKTPMSSLPTTTPGTRPTTKAPNTSQPMIIPTPKPKTAPTTIPTVGPTNTSRPTIAAPKATKAPSRGPILSIPTNSPSYKAKSKAPAKTPISPLPTTMPRATSPTKAPNTNTSQPMIIPTLKPKTAPTSIPAVGPTRSPSAAPTTTNTVPPSKAPINVIKTTAPVDMSTASPTLAPKFVRTNAPRSRPSTTQPTMTPITNSCTDVKFNLYDTKSNSIVTKISDKTVIVNPPSCNQLNIEAVISCDENDDSASGMFNRNENTVVVIELYDGNAELLHRQEEHSSPYYLFGNAGRYVRDGRITGGTYTIRAIVNGTIFSPEIQFALGGRCPEIPTNCTTDTNVSWNLIDTETDSIVASIRNRTIVADPPPCTRTSIEAVLPCPPSVNIGPVYIELYDTSDQLIYEKMERHSRYVLFGNVDDSISNGNIPSGQYMIRAIYNENKTISPFTSFTLNGRCQ